MTNYILRIFFILFFICGQLVASKTFKTKEIYLSFESYPKQVFTGQKFDVILKAMILKNKNTYNKIVTKVSQEDHIALLTKTIRWTKRKDGSFVAKLTFKAFDQKFLMPKITLNLMQGNKVVDSASANNIEIKYRKIAINQKSFSNIIAQDLKIVSVKTKQYSNTLLHNTIQIEGLNSNLEDIKLAQYQEQGISDLSSKDSKQILYYYVITPINTKQINFTYYNTQKNRFIKMQVPIILKEDLVSTQTELNPYNSSLLLYKQIFAGSLLLIFILIYFLTKNPLYLVFVAVLILIVAYLFIPNKKVVLSKNTYIYILPTKNSTVYNKLDKEYIVEKINDKGKFIKVLFKNNNIGWVKKSDIK